ncbi:hypothetical protein GCM10027422_43680 [Hymenobacter arcticus]
MNTPANKPPSQLRQLTQGFALVPMLLAVLFTGLGGVSKFRDIGCGNGNLLLVAGGTIIAAAVGVAWFKDRAARRQP